MSKKEQISAQDQAIHDLMNNKLINMSEVSQHLLSDKDRFTAVRIIQSRVKHNSSFRDEEKSNLMSPIRTLKRIIDDILYPPPENNSAEPETVNEKSTT